MEYFAIALFGALTCCAVAFIGVAMLMYYIKSDDTKDIEINGEFVHNFLGSFSPEERRKSRFFVNKDGVCALSNMPRLEENKA